VCNVLKVEFRQDEFDALSSLAFNDGVGTLSKSTLGRNVNAGDQRQRGRSIRWLEQRRSEVAMAGPTNHGADEEESFLSKEGERT
jgi:GH24 family phage-related lysozyme (muramidase)